MITIQQRLYSICKHIQPTFSSSLRQSSSPFRLLSTNPARMQAPKNPVIIYGMYGSTCTQRVMMTILENGVDFELRTVDLRKGEHKQPAHLARQPFGQIPALEDGDVHIYESRAIARYINHTRGNKLVPQDAKGLGLMEQWASLEQGTITPEISGIVGQRVFAPMFGGKTDETQVQKHADKVVKALDIMDKHLSSNAYLAGSQYSLADLFMLPYFGLLFTTPEKHLFESRANIMAWWKRCSEREAWKQVQSKNEFRAKAQVDDTAKTSHVHEEKEKEEVH